MEILDVRANRFSDGQAEEDEQAEENMEAMRKFFTISDSPGIVQLCNGVNKEEREGIP